MANTMTESELLHHFQMLLDAKEKTFVLMVGQIDRVLDEREKQLKLAREVTDRELFHINSLRAEVVTDRMMFLSKAEYDGRHKELEILFKAMAKEVDSLRGSLYVLIPVAAILGGLIGVLLKHALGG